MKLSGLLHAPATSSIGGHTTFSGKVGPRVGFPLMEHARSQHMLIVVLVHLGICFYDNCKVWESLSTSG
jgi:hypothetical protein